MEKAKQPSITCPKCGWTSYNASDIKYRYCGNCHQYHEFLFVEEGDGQKMDNRIMKYAEEYYSLDQIQKLLEDPIGKFNAFFKLISEAITQKEKDIDKCKKNIQDYSKEINELSNFKNKLDMLRDRLNKGGSDGK